MLKGGKCRSIAEIAETEKIDRSFVSRLLRLTLLAPDIQEAILEGRQREGLTVGGAPHQRYTARLTAPVPGSFAPATGTPG
jgi:hypothetical protein